MAAPSTATVQRCKLAFFTGVNEGCDPDLSWWEWSGKFGNITPWSCEPARTSYLQCVAAGIPPAPAPAPPPVLPTDTAGNHGGIDLTQQVDDATRAKHEGWAQILSSYFGEEKAPGTDGDSTTFGVPTEYLLYGALAVAGVLLIRGRR